ncbi:MAG: hypothetical protein NTW84_04830 [Methanothrix sp.]|nr:hypothetical protein [Methanothrix sp.]
MKKMLLSAALICFAALFLAGLAMAADAKAPQIQVLSSYEGNLSEKKINLVSMSALFAWDGFNGTVQSVPRERIIALDIRDKDLNLLYRFADSQLPFSNYLFNVTEAYPLTIELPSVPVSDEFYVSFYDRGAVAVAGEVLNNTSNNSFFFNAVADELIPAELPQGQNKTSPVNWIMSVSGA